MTEYTIPTYRVHLVRDGRPLHCRSDDVAAPIIRHVCCEDPTVETMTVLFLDGRSRVRGQQVVARGGAHALVIKAREVFAAALRAGASAIILGHNHPSGDPYPSEPDDKLTEAIRQAGDVLGVPLLDHVIVTDEDTHYSYREAGRCGLGS